MLEPTLNYVSCSELWAVAPNPKNDAPLTVPQHRMAYWEWNTPGDAHGAHVVLCVHGLSRQGRDFDVLARALVERSPQPLRVICPDVVGRGQSDWLKDPMAYQIPNYAADMLALLAQLQPTTLDWVGTSMGGLIGIAVAAHAAAAGVGVRRLVLNDVGPVVQWDSITRIATYLGRSMAFDSLQQAADAMWSVSTSFGPHTPAQWLELSRHMVKPTADGKVGLHYDPAIAVPVRSMTREQAAQGEALLWQLYDGLTTQTLLLRGADSDLLSAATAHAMTTRGPKARLVEFAGVGHAPTLIAPDQVDTVVSFLRE
jgi:pimeloyl-ACP methyl ester carboxylesterase